MSVILKNYGFLLIIAILFIFLSCSEKPTTPIYQDPEIIVDINGIISLHYEALGYLNKIDSVFIFSSTFKTDSINYSLFMNFYFKDNIRTGVYQITNEIPKNDSNYIAIIFLVGDKETGEKYISSSGSAIITSVQGTKISGTFGFSAKEEKSDKVIIGSNGIINIIQ